MAVKLSTLNDYTNIILFRSGETGPVQTRTECQEYIQWIYLAKGPDGALGFKMLYCPKVRFGM